MPCRICAKRPWMSSRRMLPTWYRSNKRCFWSSCWRISCCFLITTLISYEIRGCYTFKNTHKPLFYRVINATKGVRCSLTPFRVLWHIQQDPRVWYVDVLLTAVWNHHTMHVPMDGADEAQSPLAESALSKDTHWPEQHPGPIWACRIDSWDVQVAE